MLDNSSLCSAARSRAWRCLLPSRCDEARAFGFDALRARRSDEY